MVLFLPSAIASIASATRRARCSRPRDSRPIRQFPTPPFVRRSAGRRAFDLDECDKRDPFAGAASAPARNRARSRRRLPNCRQRFFMRPDPRPQRSDLWSAFVLQKSGDHEGKFKRLIGIQPRIAMGEIAASADRSSWSGRRRRLCIRSRRFRTFRCGRRRRLFPRPVDGGRNLYLARRCGSNGRVL